MIREVINCQPPRPKCANPDLGSIDPDITSTVSSLFASSLRPSNSGAREGSRALDVL